MPTMANSVSIASTTTKITPERRRECLGLGMECARRLALHYVCGRSAGRSELGGFADAQQLDFQVEPDVAGVLDCLDRLHVKGEFLVDDGLDVPRHNQNPLQLDRA